MRGRNKGDQKKETCMYIRVHELYTHMIDAWAFKGTTIGYISHASVKIVRCNYWYSVKIVPWRLAVGTTEFVLDSNLYTY